MKNNALFLIVLFFCGACSSPYYLSKPAEFKYQVKGLTFEANLDEGLILFGEIIELDSESITILPIGPQRKEMTTISKTQIKSAEIIVSSTSDNSQKIGTWAGLTNIESIGHGIVGIVTLPINLAVTIPIAIDASKGTYRIKYPENISWDEMTKFARFPQGIPENINPKDIY